MFDPLRPLKYLPWIELLQVSLFTIGLTIAIDVLFLQLVRIPAVYPTIAQLFNSPFGLLIVLGAAVGVGALAVAIMERWFRQIVITNTTLWALVPCLGLWLWLRSFLTVFPQLLTPVLSFESIVCIILGVFWKGKPYWR
ncbi:hypothetical protein LEP3755_37560 [Leptolyngbya sp. NIES-3755]|nr:hypothetical protein LEP3755_37560 [Leptolyngbya sp. NIES-3755]